MLKRWAAEPRPTTTAVEARLLPALAPQFARLGDDTWALAQRNPALVADPALVAQAGRLLATGRRLLWREPGHRLLPQSIPAGIGLAALALLLRQLQAGIARYEARRAPPEPRSIDDDIDDINRLSALVLSDMAGTLAVNRGIELPGDLGRRRKKLIPAVSDPA